MANPQHVEWLKEGVEAWNQRRATDDFTPELFDADLRGAKLQGADLQEADLRGADLQGAELRGAKLWRANLREADLQGADLQGADLRRADLIQADLIEADLRGADLRGAELLGADLIEAELRGADVTSAVGINHKSTAEVTDLSLSFGLNQTQLDSMRGDSETILPDHLERPKHWPVFELLEADPEPEVSDTKETALTNKIVTASSIDVSISDEGISANIPAGQELTYRTLAPTCAERLDALVENALTIAASSGNLGQDIRDDLIAYADHVTNNDPANPHRLVFLSKGIAAEATDPLKAEALSNRTRTQLGEFQIQHHEFLKHCIPSVAEAVETKANARLSRSISKQEATEILDTLDQSIRDTEAVMDSMALVLQDLRVVDDELNAFQTKIFTAADKAKLERAVEDETKEVASIAARVYYRAKQVVDAARTAGGDIGIAVTVSGKSAPEIAQVLITKLEPLMRKLGELLTALPPM